MPMLSGNWQVVKGEAYTESLKTTAREVIALDRRLCSAGGIGGLDRLNA